MYERKVPPGKKAKRSVFAASAACPHVQLTPAVKAAVLTTKLQPEDQKFYLTLKDH